MEIEMHRILIKNLEKAQAGIAQLVGMSSYIPKVCRFNSQLECVQKAANQYSFSH